MFVSQHWRCAFDQIEKTLASWRDVGTVLDVVGRQIALRGLVISLVEKCLESFEDKPRSIPRLSSSFQVLLV